MDICKIREYFSLDSKFCIYTMSHTDVPMHQHAFFELAYVLEGSAMNIVGKKTYKIKKGDYFIMDRFSTHAYSSIRRQPFVVINCLFLPDIFDNTLSQCTKLSELLNNYLIKFEYKNLSVPPEQCMFQDEDGEVLKILQIMQKESNEKKAGYTEMIRSYLIQILILTMRKIASNRKTPTVSARIITYIENNFNTEIALGDLCSELCYSLPYLSKKIKEETGYTFTEWLQKIRLRECCRMLLNDNSKIEYIARECGFVDMNYFRTIFKKNIGVSPREYRKRFYDNISCRYDQ